MEITKEIREKIVADVEKFQEEINSCLNVAKKETLSPTGNFSEENKAFELYPNMKQREVVFLRLNKAKHDIEKIEEMLKAWETIARI